MSKSQVVTLRVPMELKFRLEHEAKHQGVSINNLANYLLTTQLSQLEALSSIEERLENRKITDLKDNVKKILKAVPKRKPVPAWDSI
ncbi:MAG: toxin-antitoxin system HicB family antitoxin [Gammaproteobacteria bacterium]|nr:toxin-antitoxin system HicB family antitoxin [Gammaproteobacteria bacterium]